MVPSLASNPINSAETTSTSIVVRCECGKTLRAPAAAAGKAVKCTCGKIVKVPGQPNRAVAATLQPQAQPKQMGAAVNPFNALSDADWASFAPKPAPVRDMNAPKKESVTNSILNQARADLGQDKKSLRSGAGGHLASSRWILIGIGALKLALCIFQLVEANAAAAAIAEGAEDIDVDEILFVIQVIAGFGIATSVLLILMGIFVFLMPMTCAISALVLFVLLEIVSFIFNPFLLVNVRAWIVRGAMFGALVQAINNAAYYKFVRDGG